MIKRIVITGGPCAGKTSAIPLLRKRLTEEGYNVIVLSETATELISGGIAPWTLESRTDFQRTLYRLQRSREEIYNSSLPFLNDQQKIIILFDRGLLDGETYISAEDFADIMSEHHDTRDSVYARYDAVIHMESLAKSGEGLFNGKKDNNPVRIENMEEASMLDDRIKETWSGHHSYYFIGNEASFSKKFDRLFSVIKAEIEK